MAAGCCGRGETAAGRGGGAGGRKSEAGGGPRRAEGISAAGDRGSGAGAESVQKQRLPGAVRGFSEAEIRVAVPEEISGRRSRRQKAGGRKQKCPEESAGRSEKAFRGQPGRDSEGAGRLPAPRKRAGAADRAVYGGIFSQKTPEKRAVLFGSGAFCPGDSAEAHARGMGAHGRGPGAVGAFCGNHDRRIPGQQLRAGISAGGGGRNRKRRVQPLYGWGYEAGHLQLPAGQAGAVSGKIQQLPVGRGELPPDRSQPEFPEPEPGGEYGEFLFRPDHAAGAGRTGL